MTLSKRWLVVTALSGAGLLLSTGCSSSTCGPSSCANGCCDQNGSCQPGTTSLLCGASGGACAACGTGQACQAGVCGGADGGSDGGAMCSASTCPSGCCAGTVCLTYNRQTDNACGASGAACHACTVGTQTCQGGACVTGCGSNNCDGCCSTAGTCIHLNSNGGTQTTSQCGYGGAVCQMCVAGDTCTDDGLCVVPTDAGTDGGNTFDFPCGNFSPCQETQACCTSFTSSSVNFACVAPASCPTGDSITCDGPEECPGTAPFCCGIEILDGGSAPNCAVAQLGATCQANCPFQTGSNCAGTNEVVLCHTSADCSSVPNNYNNCCQFTQNGATLTFCVTSGLAFFANQCF